MKENGEFKYEIFDIVYQIVCKCHSVPPPSTTIKNKNCCNSRRKKSDTYPTDSDMAFPVSNAKISM
jgi:hypothetical protein